MLMRETDQSDPENPWLHEANVRIQRQIALIAKLEPSTDDHRHATRVLLILQDSMHAMIEATKTIARLRRNRLLDDQ